MRRAIVRKREPVEPADPSKCRTQTQDRRFAAFRPPSGPLSLVVSGEPAHFHTIRLAKLKQNIRYRYRKHAQSKEAIRETE